MSWVDYSILGILVLSVIVGVVRGFVREVLGLATWVGAAAVTFLFGDSVARQLSPVISVPEVRVIAGKALLFIGALFIGALITHLIGALVRESPVAPIDRTLGGLYGMARGLIAVVIVIMLADASSTTREQRWWNESVLIPPLLPLANTVRGWIPPRWLAPLKPSTNESSAAAVAGGK